MARKKTYGIFNNTVKVKYGIAIFDKPNELTWVTKIIPKVSSSPFPKGEYETAKGEQAWFTDDREEAEILSTSICALGNAAFVVAIPELSENDYYGRFVNER